MTYALGATSRSRLVGVHPRLVAVVERAIGATLQDFAVTCGTRTVEEQRALVAAGKSRTMQSRHLVQADGLGHAVDLVPYVGGAPRWDAWPPFYAVARAVRDAARVEDLALTWGCVWDRDLRELGDDIAGEVAAYCQRHAGIDFLDGPHFEIRT